jgi:hypothetical protein
MSTPEHDPTGSSPASDNQRPTTFTSQTTSSTPTSGPPGPPPTSIFAVFAEDGQYSIVASDARFSSKTSGGSLPHAGSGGGLGWGAILAESETGNSVVAISKSGIGVTAQSDSGIALQVFGRVAIGGSAVGQATISKGQTSVTVSASAATPSSNILLTPLGDPKGTLWVTRAMGSFTIEISAAPASDLAIAYLIIN